MTPQHIVWCRCSATRLWITQPQLLKLLMDTDWSPLFSQPMGLILAIAGFIGACMGSFLTLVTYRLPRDEKIGMTRSRCPNCSTTLQVFDLIPIFTWIGARGRCRHCKTRVSIRYPLTELACAVGAALSVYYYGITFEALAIMILWWSIVAIIVTDLEHYIILDEVQIAIALSGILFCYATNVGAMDAIAAAIAGGAIGLALKYGFIYFRNKDGLGMGDVKFLFAAGFWLHNAANFVPFLFFSGMLGIVCGLLWRVLGLGERFPFGPSLAASLLLCVVWPDAANGFWQLYGLLQ